MCFLSLHFASIYKSLGCLDRFALIGLCFINLASEPMIQK